MKTNIIFVIFFWGISAFLLYSQKNANPYFPLQIGNRWDYFVTITINGGIEYYDTLSYEITNKIMMDNGFEYFEFSKNLDYPLTSKYFREENNKIYMFEEEDSIDCFILRFDLPPDTFYYDCKMNYHSIGFIDTMLYWYPPEEIIIQGQNNHWFAKRFGILDYWKGGLATRHFELRGCIINDTTYGRLLVSTDNPIEPVNEFVLYQNYPNPLNPITTIKYSIPCSDNITIKIYDILGAELKTLVNEYKKAGEYEIKFNAGDLPSGIYFYRLTAGDPSTDSGQDFIKTKKMVLLR